MDWEEHFSMENALQAAFSRLDTDVCHEAFPSGHKLNTELLAVALSGITLLLY